MGREATVWLTYGEAAGEGRVLLESDDLILRGRVKARIPRAALAHARVDGPDLVIDAPGGPLRLSLGAVEAGRWLTALSKPAPTLPDKLGVKAGTRLWAWGTGGGADAGGRPRRGRDGRPRRGRSDGRGGRGAG